MILVLKPDVEEGVLERIRKELEALGCSFHPSLGDEQLVAALGGNFDPDAVHAAAAAWPEVDALSLQSDRDYRSERRRRQAMKWLILGFGLLTLAALMFPVVQFLMPPATPFSLSGPVRVTSLDRFPAGTASKLRLHGVPVMVVRDHAGRFHAVSGDCTHIDPCRLEWSLERQQLLCPCHGGVFDPLGNVVDGPANAPLQRYDTAVVNEVLFVQPRR